jgi:hypothetical protein
MSETVTHESDCQGFGADGQALATGICRSWCYGCMRCEPLHDNDYRVCGECMHVYRTG